MLTALIGAARQHPVIMSVVCFYALFAAGLAYAMLTAKTERDTGEPQ